MKKIFALMCVAFVLTGCTANYEIRIKNGKISEKLVLLETDKSLFDASNDTGWTLRQSFDALKENDEFSKQNYKIKSINDLEKLGIEYESDNIKSILNSSLLNQCYTDFSVIEDDNIITIDTGNQFECYDYYDSLETVKVVLKTNHKVVSNNADEVNNNTYIWNITKNGNKRINISYSEEFERDNSLVYYIIIAIVLLLSIAFYFVYKKIKKENKI